MRLTFLPKLAGLSLLTRPPRGTRPCEGAMATLQRVWPFAHEGPQSLVLFLADCCSWGVGVQVSQLASSAQQSRHISLARLNLFGNFEASAFFGHDTPRGYVFSNRAKAGMPSMTADQTIATLASGLCCSIDR